MERTQRCGEIKSRRERSSPNWGLKKPKSPTFVPPPEPPIGTTTNIDELFEEEADLMRKDKVEKSKSKFKPLDRVKIKTIRFGKSFAKGRPVYTFGTIMKIKGKFCDVQWDDSEGVELMKSHSDFLEAANDKVKGDAVMALYLANEP